MTGEQAVTTAAASNYGTATVRAVQQALNERGYNAGPVDGQWGATTQEAVKRFQRASGLPDTGELGPATLSALGVS
jgi:peptidoglycan hydrolase-like protein with peptidoglycan-binding domain